MEYKLNEPNNNINYGSNIGAEGRTKVCRRCKSKIPIMAELCPVCGKKQTGIGAKYIVLIIIAFLLLLFLFVGNEDDDKPSDYLADTSEESLNDDQIAKEKTEINESVIYEKNDVKIVAKGCEDFGNEMNVNFYIENNSNLNLNFAVNSYAINGIMAGNNIYDMYTSIASGKKANTTLEIPESVFEAYGIDSVKYLDILIWAYDDDASYKEFDTGTIRIETNKYDGKSVKLSGETLYNEKSVIVEYMYCSGNKYTYCITNNTEENANFEITKISVNDFGVSLDDYNWLYSSSEIFSGCQGILILELDENFLEKNEIKEIEKIEFCLDCNYGYYNYENNFETGIVRTTF